MSNIEQTKQVQNYVIDRTLGKGTFGKVKLGYHTICDEYVAVKILEKRKIETDADFIRVQREIAILRKVEHPNVIKLYEILESDTNLYLVMEYAKGGELFDYIVKKNQLSELAATKFFIQLIDAVEYLHTQKIVHRDLKPENLLLDEQRNLKVADFGLSNIYKESDQVKTACGSPCYAAPEMLYGKLYGGQKSDIWSCGIILYAMLCGYLPFEHENTKKLYEMIKYEDYDKPKNISPAAQDLLKQLLTKDPSLRIGFQEIKHHPFYKKMVIQPQQGLVTKDQDVLKQLSDLGYDVNNVIDQVKKKKHNTYTAAYWLLLKKSSSNQQPIAKQTSLLLQQTQQQLKKNQILQSQLQQIYQPMEYKQLQGSTGGSNSKEKIQQPRQFRYSVPHNKNRIDYSQFQDVYTGIQNKLNNIQLQCKQNTNTIIDFVRQKTHSVQEKTHCHTPDQVDLVIKQPGKKIQLLLQRRKNPTEQMEKQENTDVGLKEKMKDLTKRSRNKTQPLKKVNEKMERYANNYTQQLIKQNSPQDSFIAKFYKPSIRVRHSSNHENTLKHNGILTHNFV
ncbi:unnamed protein product [Paramecium octaurelia]|uniref:non-specific serine/threonine protein kinase n=1 Tax=Paramecium octaurelia TaxID=43137 RepID=A0A8S1UNX7_PAROT|nr:unnamed protein product [Paramecium octaurelia]